MRRRKRIRSLKQIEKELWQELELVGEVFRRQAVVVEEEEKEEEVEEEEEEEEVEIVQFGKR